MYKFFDNATKSLKLRLLIKDEKQKDEQHIQTKHVPIRRRLHVWAVGSLCGAAARCEVSDRNIT